MIIDTHVHLFAGRDDGPATLDVAVGLCRMLKDEGAVAALGVAHQNPMYPNNTADELRSAHSELLAELGRVDCRLRVRPAGEVMLLESTAADLAAGQLLTVADARQVLLVEMPPGLFLDVLPLTRVLAGTGIRLLIAHAERYEELLFDEPMAERWIAAGCLMQFTASELADPPTRNHRAAMRSWATRGMVHTICSDGHNLEWRLPRLRDGAKVLRSWVTGAANNILHDWPARLLAGEPLIPPKPRPFERSWFGRLFGG